MSQPSLSQTSDANPYAEMDIYGQNSNYMDQVTNGYNQMNLNQVLPRTSLLTKNTEYPPFVGAPSHSGQHYDPMTDMYFQPSTNYQPVQSPALTRLILAAIPSLLLIGSEENRSSWKSEKCSRLFYSR